jgi:hypothetical protein
MPGSALSACILKRLAPSLLHTLATETDTIVDMLNEVGTQEMLLGEHLG